MILRRDVEPKSKLKYQKLFNAKFDNISDKVKEFMSNLKETKRGLFMTVDKKIIGFLTYDTDELNVSCGLSFFLIDKDYRYQGYGTLFMELFIRLLDVVKIEDTDNINWYRKFGFKNKEEYKNPIFYNETKTFQFKYLYYIKN